MNSDRKTPMPRKIIIDTDPGQDDAMAILLALASPELGVLGLTIVAGNVGLEHTQTNARKICELAGRPDIGVFAGCSAPLSRQLITAEHVHGTTGLDGIELPEPQMPLQPTHAVDFIIDTLRTQPAHTVSMVAIGPLTNLAQALTRAPDIGPRLREIVVMGGACFEGGNVTPAAEFNIHADPEAAEIVFAAGVDLTVVPLDVTHQALTDATWINGLRRHGLIGEAVASWADSYDRHQRDRYGDIGAPLHDPCAIAWLLAPQIFQGRFVNIEIETQGRFTAGTTIADWWQVSGRIPNATLLRHIDRQAFLTLLDDAIHRLSKQAA